MNGYTPTPGPWRIYDDGTIGSAAVRIPGQTDVILPGSVKGATIGEAMANAQLIAAAPALAEALAAVVAAFHDHPDRDESSLALARVALAAAGWEGGAR